MNVIFYILQQLLIILLFLKISFSLFFSTFTFYSPEPLQHKNTTEFLITNGFSSQLDFSYRNVAKTVG